MSPARFVGRLADLTDTTRSARPRCAWLACTLVAIIVAGCGGDTPPKRAGAELEVTRDHGASVVGRARDAALPTGDTAVTILQRHFEVEADAGRVRSIEGYASGSRRGRSSEWRLYVNGIEVPSAEAAAYKLTGSERVWWDLHDGGAVTRVPAVVGSFPEPFLTGVAGKRRPLRVDCAPSADRLCDEVTARLGDVGIDAVARAQVNGPAGPEIFRIVVGTWSEIRIDPTIRQLEREPAASGVFARFGALGRRLDIYDSGGRAVRTLGPGSGLVAATRFEGQQPTWVVTGTDYAGAAAAAGAFRKSALARRFAVASADGNGIALPVRGPAADTGT